MLRLAVDHHRQHRRLQDELLGAERLRDSLERRRGGGQAHRRQGLDTETKRPKCEHTNTKLIYRGGLKSGPVLLSKSQGRKFLQPRDHFLAQL